MFSRHLFWTPDWTELVADKNTEHGTDSRVLSCVVCMEDLWPAHPSVLMSTLPHSESPGQGSHLKTALAYFSQDFIPSLLLPDTLQSPGLWEATCFLPLYSQGEHLLCCSVQTTDCPRVQLHLHPPTPWNFLSSLQCCRCWPSSHSQSSCLALRDCPLLLLHWFFKSSYGLSHQTKDRDYVLSITWGPHSTL